MFKFDFQADVEGNRAENADIAAEEGEATTDHSPKVSATEKTEWKSAKRQCFDKTEISVVSERVKHANLFLTGETSIGYIASTTLEGIESQSFRLAETANTDLISAVYEGGFKIWECTKDLADYLSNEEKFHDLTDKRVLDLGCGAGILGLLCLKQNGRHVEFQDYNEEVLQHVTMVNVCLNINDDDENCGVAEKVTFYSGDWASYAELTKDEPKFDVILTSETIYNAVNYEKLVDVFDEKLTNDGCVFLAAKTYYFGVGGGMRQFEAYLQSRKNYKSEVVWKNSDGVAREILKIVKFQA